jgi:DNA-binding NarL/FixJ family response regulator
MQTFTQDHLSTTARHNPFLVSMPEKLSIVQAVVTPASYAPDAGLLTPRETEILELQGRGLSIKGIARELGISAGTVKWHVRNVYWKLSASSREDALFKARQQKIIL